MVILRLGHVKKERGQRAQLGFCGYVGPTCAMSRIRGVCSLGKTVSHVEE